MSENLASPTTDLQNLWGLPLEMALCEQCDWRYLVPRSKNGQGGKMPLCPHCYQAPLQPVDDHLKEMPHPYPPELVAPYGLSEAALEQAVLQFSKGIPYAPKDLNFDSMRARLTPVYLPMWLVDSQVQAYWQAEAGFNYQVVSHQEQYSDSRRGWQTQQVREGRTRWESRVGRIWRAYQNISAPALEEAKEMKQKLGDFKLDKVQPYQPQCLENAWVRLPDRSTQDAWSDAAASFQHRAAEDCQQACSADHMRYYKWKARFQKLNWSLLLLPTYSTYYLDDENKPQQVLIHGQTGKSNGKRRASMVRAQRASLILLIVGLIFSVLGLITGGLTMVFPPLAALAFIGLLIGIPLMMGALIPIGIAWDFNRKSGG